MELGDRKTYIVLVRDSVGNIREMKFKCKSEFEEYMAYNRNCKFIKEVI